jgi:hypothetical protein
VGRLAPAGGIAVGAGVIAEFVRSQQHAFDFRLSRVRTVHGGVLSTMWAGCRRSFPPRRAVGANSG